MVRSVLLRHCLAIVTAIGVGISLPEVPAGSSTAGRLNHLRIPKIRWGLVTTLRHLPRRLLRLHLPVRGHRTSNRHGQRRRRGAHDRLWSRRIPHQPDHRQDCRQIRDRSNPESRPDRHDRTARRLGRADRKRRSHRGHDPLLPLLFALGAAWWSGGITQPTHIAGHATVQRSQTLGLRFSAQFLGVAVGGAAGGLALSSAGPVAAPLVSAVVAATLASIRLTTPTTSAQRASMPLPTHAPSQ